MPLPFSFSIQRQGSEAETPAVTTVVSAAEKMNFGPEHVSTEPVRERPGRAYFPQMKSKQMPFDPSPMLHYSGLQGTFGTAENATFERLNPLPAHELATQIEQLRNDVFGIAMSVSALNDRLDRLEQSPPQNTQSVHSEVARLRGEIEIWLENHLNSAVEHCMYRHSNRTPPTTVYPAN